MLFCSNLLAITLSVSPPVHRRTQRQEGSIDGLENREWLLVQASQPEEAVTGFPLTAAAM